MKLWQAHAKKAALARPLGLIVAVMVWGEPLGARAQVNTETLRDDLKSRPRFVTVDGSLTGRMGNTNGTVAGVSVFGALSGGPHLLFAKAKADYARLSGVTSVDSSFLHVRYNYLFTERLAGELFGQIQQDKFQSLLYRSLYGIGPRYSIIEEPDIELTAGISYMFEFERISASPGQSLPNIDTAHRLNQYVDFVYKIEKTVRVSWVAYLQPEIQKFSNRRFLGEGSFRLDATPRLSAKLGVTARYDTDPAPGVHHYDLEVRNSLSVTF